MIDIEMANIEQLSEMPTPVHARKKKASNFPITKIIRRKDKRFIDPLDREFAT
jgi:hypothetical protein